jgi:hypothetical protein
MRVCCKDGLLTRRIIITQAYHTSAVLAALVDASTTPWRLRRAAALPPARAALGSMELSDALSLLNGGNGGGSVRPFAAAALSLPAPPVPRVQPGAGTGAQPALDMATLVSLSEGIPSLLEAPLVEAYALRGLRWGDADARAPFAADAAAAHAAAQAALRAAGVRCVRALCAAGAPLPVPLSYPRILHRSASAASAPQPPPPNPAEVSALSRLAATEEWGPLLRDTAADFRRLARGAAGAAAMRSWGYSACDADESAEGLSTLAAAYTSDGDSDEDDGGEM